LVVAAAAGYFYLDAEIARGQTQWNLGQARMEAGSKALDGGLDRLHAGEKKLSRGRHAYQQAKGNPFLVLGDAVLHGGKNFTNARSRIATGEKKVAAGKIAVRDGRKQLDAGQAGLARGKQQLAKAQAARSACGWASIFLFALFVALVFFWRRSLAVTFKRGGRV